MESGWNHRAPRIDGWVMGAFLRGIYPIFFLFFSSLLIFFSHMFLYLNHLALLFLFFNRIYHLMLTLGRGEELSMHILFYTRE